MPAFDIPVKACQAEANNPRMVQQRYQGKLIRE